MQKKNKSFFFAALIVATFVIGCDGEDKFLSMDIGDAAENTTKTFLVKCQGQCKNINVTVNVDAGDPDLFVSENKLPKIGNITLSV